MHPKTRQKLILTLVGWLAAGLIFFPIFWMILTSFKTEVEAVATPPKLFFSPTLENYVTVARARRLRPLRDQQCRHLCRGHAARDVDRRAGRLRHGFFSRQAHQGPAALDAIDQDDAGGRRADPDLPAVPRSRALSTRGSGLTIVYTLMNLPIVVWMLYTFFKEVPKDILEAGRMDGARPKQEVWLLLMPLSLPGHRIDGAAFDHPVLERGVLEPQSHDLERGAAHDLHRVVLRPGGAVLGEALRGIDDRDRADSRLRLDEPAAARARPHLRRRQVTGGCNGDCHTQAHPEELRRRAGDQGRRSVDRGSRVLRLRRPVRLRKVDAACG